MDSSKGSFIPKSPVSTVSKKRPVRRLYILSYLIYSVFAGAVVLAGVTFFYELTQNQQLNAKLNQLAQERGAFEAEELTRLAALDTRLDYAASLLSGYNSVRTLLAALEEVTVATVTLAGFSYTQGESNQIELTLQADSPNFDVALFQRKQLEQHPVLRGASVTGVSYSSSEEGGAAVQFTITQSLAPGQLAFERRATAVPATAALPSEVVSTPASEAVTEQVPETDSQ